MKIGDIIARKDMPWIAYQIVSENTNFPAWNVELAKFSAKKGVHKKGMVFKDDNRWVVVQSQGR